MSKLGEGLKAVRGGGGGRGLPVPVGTGLVLFLVVAAAAFVLAAFVLAGLYAYVSPYLPSPQQPPTTTMPPENRSQPPTTTAAPATTTLPPSTTTSSTTTQPPAPTSTQPPTTTTLSAEQVTLCILTKVNSIYVGGDLKSRSLETYLNQTGYAFQLTSCKTADEKGDCDGELSAYIEAGRMIYDGKQWPAGNRPGYPVVVLSKDGTAYYVQSAAAFEKLVGCGSLKET
jgi:hypothetical protein